jgi:hypothetical protein
VTVVSLLGHGALSRIGRPEVNRRRMGPIQARFTKLRICLFKY